MLWKNTNFLGFDIATNSRGFFLAKDNNGSVFNTGWVTQNSVFNSTTLNSYGGYDIYVAKLDAITGFSEIAERTSNNSLLIYANPNEGICNIKIPEELKNATKLNLKIIDANSRLVQETNFSIVNGKLTINISDEAKGIYTAIISDGSRKFTGKIVFE